jgi:glutamine amidotransferase PdxT
MKNIYDGTVVTDANGDATVNLPAYMEALNDGFRYQLTVIGTFAQAIVATEIKDNRFTIKTSAANVKVSWMVTGIRRDAYATKSAFQLRRTSRNASAVTTFIRMPSISLRRVRGTGAQP